jgi:hypothetical protein
VNWVEIDVDKDAEDLDHRISPEERLRLTTGPVINEVAPAGAPS